MSSNANTESFLRRIVRPVVYLGQNRLSQLGVALTTTSAFTLVCLYFAEFAGAREGPYVGIIAFFALPALFLVGLLMIAAGILFRFRSQRNSGELPDQYPLVDFRQAHLRETVTFVAVMTGVNMLLFLTATYKAVSYMDTTQFCGQTCHTPMTPEFTAYKNAPHSRVDCVDCHVGPGFTGFVQAKVAGTRQLMGVVFNNYPRPIPSPVHSMRPASETCEHCHWPRRFTGDKIWVRKKYSEDEKNTALTTVLLLRIGGVNQEGEQGIHGHHLDNGSPRVQFISTDAERQVIAQVRYRNENGSTDHFASADPKVTPDRLAKGEHRDMDCIDCHSRPTHDFQLPERAVDTAMAEGRVCTDLPWIKKKAVETLKVSYPSQEIASQKIPAAIQGFYRTSYPAIYAGRRADVDKAAEQIKAIYIHNVFPDMKLTWGTHPNNLGHEDFLGCFRCHDGNHTTQSGKTITNDCGACHTLLAVEDPNPKILADMGMK